MEIIENPSKYAERARSWRGDERLSGYPFVRNVYAPFTPLRRALPMLNLALISTAGAYIDGTDPFDNAIAGGDIGSREIPVAVEAADLRYAARGYRPEFVEQDRNSLVPVDRLLGYQDNSVIGKLNNVWWSVSSYLPDATRVADELAPALSERLRRYDVHAALIIPASRLCHQTAGLIARRLEMDGIPTITISVDRRISEEVRPPRTAYHVGNFGEVVGEPMWPEFQLRVLDETLRNLETFDQPGIRKLAVALESQVEAARGER